jgi:hypothetical protein
MSGLLSSLAAFAKAGIRPRTPLARAIAVALAIKLCVVVSARIFLFGADSRPVVNEEAVVRHLSPPAVSRLP